MIDMTRLTIIPPDHDPHKADTCAIVRMNVGQQEMRYELTPQRARQLAIMLLQLAEEHECRRSA